MENQFFPPHWLGKVIALTYLGTPVGPNGQTPGVQGKLLYELSGAIVITGVNDVEILIPKAIVGPSQLIGEESAIQTAPAGVLSMLDRKRSPH